MSCFQPRWWDTELLLSETQHREDSARSTLAANSPLPALGTTQLRSYSQVLPKESIRTKDTRKNQMASSICISPRHVPGEAAP